MLFFKRAFAKYYGVFLRIQTTNSITTIYLNFRENATIQKQSERLWYQTLFSMLSFKPVACANKVSAQISETSPWTVAFAIFPPDILQDLMQDSDQVTKDCCAL